MEEKNKLLVSVSPHLNSGMSTSKIMWSVTVCLIPAGAWGVYIFGVGALFVLFASICSAVLTEFIITKLQGKNVVFDGSAFLTGLLIGYNMPPDVPGFIPVIASVFAIAIVKHVFGGLGNNWMNPALAGRVFVMFSWTNQMTTWTPPRFTFLSNLLGATNYGKVMSEYSAVSGASENIYDVLSGATPLSSYPQAFSNTGTYWDLFLGNIAGCIGEISALLLILGAVYLLIKKIITWQIPVCYIGTFAFLVFIFGGTDWNEETREVFRVLFSGDVLFHLFSGGLMLGAFYMATDMVTTPLTSKGMIIFGVGAGVLTFLIRLFGGFPEGVSLAIILMNMSVPLINRYTRPVKFGFVPVKEEEK